MLRPTLMRRSDTVLQPCSMLVSRPPVAAIIQAAARSMALLSPRSQPRNLVLAQSNKHAFGYGIGLQARCTIRGHTSAHARTNASTGTRPCARPYLKAKPFNRIFFGATGKLSVWQRRSTDRDLRLNCETRKLCRLRAFPPCFKFYPF